MKSIEFRGRHAGLSKTVNAYAVDIYRGENFAQTEIMSEEEYLKAIDKVLWDDKYKIYFSGTHFKND